MTKKLTPLLVLVFTMNCQRDIRTTGNGPYTSETAISLAQDKALSKLNPYSVKTGQRVHKIETQEVVTSQGPQKILSKEWVTEVTQVEEDESFFSLTTLKKVSDKAWDKDFVYEFKDVYDLRQVKTQSLMDQLNLNSYHPSSIVEKLKESNNVQEKEIEGVAFQNLVSREVTLVPPELVKNAENCKGLKNCQIKADLITYDIVFLMTDGTTQRHQVEWHISSNVPFFAGIIKQCATTIVPLENLRVLVKQCREVVDFDY